MLGFIIGSSGTTSARSMVVRQADQRRIESELTDCLVHVV